MSVFQKTSARRLGYMALLAVGLAIALTGLWLGILQIKPRFTRVGLLESQADLSDRA